MLLTCLLFLGLAALTQNPAEENAATLSDAWIGFADPPAAFRPAPLWVWNDDLQEEELARQLDEFKAQGYGGVFVHPRPGLVTPYLSERWLSLWRFALEEARKRGMVTYLYDENSYPSGFAGGHVPDRMPESRQVLLRREILTSKKMSDTETVALYRMHGEGPADRIRLTVDPDGKSGSLSIGGLGSSRFTFKGRPFEGGVGFRSIKGRSFKVDDVRLFQVEEDGSETVIFEDRFERVALGADWIKESLVPNLDGSALDAGIEEGVLAMVHDGTMNDTWLRPDRSVRFEGRTTVFEFTLVDRSGDLGGNPALAVGAKRFEAGKTEGVMLIDIQGMEPFFNHGMVKGAWQPGIASPRAGEDRFRNVRFERVEHAVDEGTYLRYHLARAGNSAWMAGKCYVDLLRPGVGEKFLEITFDAYDTVLADAYGKQVLACFTDEPHVRGGWTPSLPAEFTKRFGYDLLDHLPSLHMETGKWRGVRHDYHALILDLYLERFVKPYARACEERGIALTGHVWEHGWPRLSSGPDTMSFNAWQQIPGIDCLMNSYSEGTNAQFGNYRAVREIASIANQFGRVRTLCEAYGAAGWEVTFQDLKRIGDWLLAGGVNLMNPHLSFYTIRGSRKADHPPSFSYHEPWWEAHGLLADYLGRLCWTLAAGCERNDLLVIEPTTTMWMLDGSPSCEAELNRLGSAFQEYITDLAANQVAFDLGSEPVMAGIARVEGARLAVGEASYGTVLLPPGLENLESTTVRLLEAFAEAGGRIVTCAGVPSYMDGRLDDGCLRIREKAGERWIEESLEWYAPAVKVVPSGGRVFHLVRELDDGHLLFVVNTSLEEGARISCEAPAGRLERWNPEDGKKEAVFASVDRTGAMRWEAELPRAGSALFAVHREGGETIVEKETDEWKPLTTEGGIEVRMLAKNVLPLDFMDLELKGEHYPGLYRHAAQTLIYRAYGFNGNCWNRAVQFKDELIRKDRFPAGSGFALRFRFTMEGFDAPPALELVVERGDRYAVSVNGHGLEALAGRWWLDRSFTVYAIEPARLQDGENVILLQADPFSIHHEPEPAYLLGDFNLRSAEHGWVIVPPSNLELGPWSSQGRPCYPNGVAYTQRVRCVDAGAAHHVALRKWSGIVARVDVNGEKAGYIGWAPWRLDLTGRMKPGVNTVTVTVFGSLKNLLGPHHQGPVRGSAWPGHFLHDLATQPPGERYDVIGYGLYEPFKVYSASGR
jgi:hypothetical protein